MSDDAAKKLADQLNIIEKEDASSKAINLIKFRKGEKLKVVLGASGDDDPLIDEPVVLVERKMNLKGPSFPFKSKWLNVLLWSLFLMIDIVIGFFVYIYFL